MKPPLKPFTVEVKRSRSSPSVAKPISSEPPVLLQTMPAPAPVAPSQARKLAEQLFTSLTVDPDVKPEIKVTAKSVFRAVAPRAATVEALATEQAPIGPAAQAPSDAEIAPAEPRKARGREGRTSALPANRIVQPKAPAIAKVAKPSAPARHEQDPRTKPVGMSSPPMKIDEVARPPSAPEAERQVRQNWGWGPGERWKKRLRHLR